jgi:hypothetical protein
VSRIGNAGAEDNLAQGDDMDTARFVGVDVSKQRLDVAVRPSGEQWSVGTDPAGLAQLVERLTTGPTPLA